MPWRIDRARLAEKVARGGEPPPSATNLSRARSFQHRLCPIRRPSPKRVAPRPSLAVALATLKWNFKLAKEGREDTTMTRRAEQKLGTQSTRWQFKGRKNGAQPTLQQRATEFKGSACHNCFAQAWQFKGPTTTLNPGVPRLRIRKASLAAEAHS